MKLKIFPVGIVLLLVWVVLPLGRSARAEEPKPRLSAVRHANAKEAADLVTKEHLVVLDVRTSSEFTSGHIAGAKNLDFLSNDFATKLAGLDRGQSYLLHCATGGRSTKALAQMTHLGFTNVVHLDGGIKAWQAAGNPVVKP